MPTSYSSDKSNRLNLADQNFKFIISVKSKADHSVSVDITELKGYFSDRFLLNIVDYLEFRSERGISFSTLSSEAAVTLNLFKKTVRAGLLEKDVQLNLISQTFLDCLPLIDNKIKENELSNLSLIFNTKFPGIFESNVTKSDIPRKKNPLGLVGARIKNILKMSYTPSTLASIMVFVENCYEEEKITIGQWAFFNLILNTRVRIGSIFQMSVEDIVYDDKADQYYAYILPEKENVVNPQKSPFLLTRSVGRILRKQRLEVLKCENSSKVQKSEQHKIALFPTNAFLNGELDESNNKLGYFNYVGSFAHMYQNKINYLLGENKIYTRVLRHSVGTHLASNGMSAKTIKAVLRHVSERTCQAYVEIHLNGNLENLSNALEPAFDKYFPVFKDFLSSYDTYDENKVIVSDDLESGEILKEGLCGSDMRCFYAPFSCYSCKKFTPFYDVDHEINLNIIESKIVKFNSQGLAFQDSIQTLKNTKAFINLTIQACNAFKRSQNDN